MNASLDRGLHDLFNQIDPESCEDDNDWDPAPWKAMDAAQFRDWVCLDDQAAGELQEYLNSVL